MSRIKYVIVFKLGKKQSNMQYYQELFSDIRKADSKSNAYMVTMNMDQSMNIQSMGVLTLIIDSKCK